MLKRRPFVLAVIMSLVGIVRAQDLPRGKNLMAKYIEAMGGEAALRDIKSMIEAENKHEPLSDSDITRILQGARYR